MAGHLLVSSGSGELTPASERESSKPAGIGHKTVHELAGDSEFPVSHGLATVEEQNLIHETW